MRDKNTYDPFNCTFILRPAKTQRQPHSHLIQGNASYRGDQAHIHLRTRPKGESITLYRAYLLGLT